MYCMVSTGKLPRRLAQEQVNRPCPKLPRKCRRAVKHQHNNFLIYTCTKFLLETCMFSSSMLVPDFGPSSLALVPGFRFPISICACAEVTSHAESYKPKRKSVGRKSFLHFTLEPNFRIIDTNLPVSFLHI